jgi:hypothetical protein
MARPRAADHRQTKPTYLVSLASSKKPMIGSASPTSPDQNGSISRASGGYLVSTIVKFCPT